MRFVEFCTPEERMPDCWVKSEEKCSMVEAALVIFLNMSALLFRASFTCRPNPRLSRAQASPKDAFNWKRPFFTASASSRPSASCLRRQEPNLRVNRPRMRKEQSTIPRRTTNRVPPEEAFQAA